MDITCLSNLCWKYWYLIQKLKLGAGFYDRAFLRGGFSRYGVLYFYGCRFLEMSGRQVLNRSKYFETCILEPLLNHHFINHHLCVPDSLARKPLALRISKFSFSQQSQKFIGSKFDIDSFVCPIWAIFRPLSTVGIPSHAWQCRCQTLAAGGRAGDPEVRCSIVTITLPIFICYIYYKQNDKNMSLPDLGNRRPNRRSI